MLILKEPFKTLWKDKDPFREVEKISGVVYREVQTRRTLRFEINGESFYLKLHRGTTVGEILKNVLTLHAPVLGANLEWEAIHHLAKAGIETMEGVAYGDTLGNPLNRVSFIITRDLAPAKPICHYFVKSKENKTLPRVKHLLIEHLAKVVRQMHQAGLNHRDCYLVHFLVKEPFDGTKENLKLPVIDLHRAHIRDKVPTRWRNKDLIGLFYSAQDYAITKTDCCRFLKIYFNAPLKEIFKKEWYLLKVAQKRSDKIKAHSAKLKNL